VQLPLSVAFQVRFGRVAISTDRHCFSIAEKNCQTATPTTSQMIKINAAPAQLRGFDFLDIPQHWDEVGYQIDRA
jgi:hypothetical protein